MTMEELVIAVRVTAEDAEAAIESLCGGFSQLGRSGEAGLAAVQKQATALSRTLQSTSAVRRQVSAYRDLTAQVKRAGGSWDDLSGEVKAFARQMGVADGDIDGVMRSLTGLEAQLDGSMQGGILAIQGVLSALETMRAQIISIPQAEITADNSQALSAIDAAIAAVNVLLALLGQAGISSGGQTVSRGGGGGGRSLRSDAEEAARAAQEAERAAEQAQEEAYQSEIERIEHRRHLGQLTAQEEIAELTRVKREYAQTAEQIMDIDERIYDARQALREAEAGKITTLNDAIVEALENRYEEQRRIEQQRISASIAAWETWSDETCAAIQRQIDALDEKEQAEDRQKTREENLRRIAALEQAIAYENDDYNLAQLQKQLTQAQAAWEKVQSDWARADERAALNAQMQAIRDQAEAEIDRLEAESARIDSVYDGLIEGQSLAAEAQKLLMESTQDDLLSLLTAYAPEYEVTGRTLGEKLYEGFVSAFGDISAWFEGLDAQFEQMAAAAQEAALGRTDAILAAGGDRAQLGSVPVIQQTVNFNQPVESAADVTRRMQQVSEELAGMI